MNPFPTLGKAALIFGISTTSPVTASPIHTQRAMCVKYVPAFIFGLFAWACGELGVLTPLTRIFHRSPRRQAVEQPSLQKQIAYFIYGLRKFPAHSAACTMQHLGRLILRVILKDDHRHQVFSETIQLIESALHVVHKNDRILEARHPVRRYFGTKQFSSK